MMLRRPSGHRKLGVRFGDAARARRRQRLLVSLLAPALAVLGLASLVLGVRVLLPDDGPSQTAERPERANAGSVKAEEALPSPAEVGADESGLVMVLEYHRVGGDPHFAPGWTISPQDFRAQLEYLHENDYHPVNFRDLVENRLDVPPGKTPVVLTFDDSSRTQFTMIERGGKLVPHPNGAVGVLAAFHEEHPDWPMRATFFVLPLAEPPNDLFGQPGLATEKLRYLTENGMEVGSHTLYHANLAESTPGAAREQLARSVVEIQKHLGPDHEVKTLGVPFGAYPEDRSVIQSGQWRGHGYAFSGAAAVSGGASHAPGDRRFDPFEVPRIQAEPQKEGFSWFADYFEEHPEDRYVSDGDPFSVSVPKGKTKLDPDALQQTGNELVRY